MWLILAGRGYGKTRTGAEWLANRLRTAPAESEWVIAAPTEKDLERYPWGGPSGILKVLPPEAIKRQIDSKGSKELELVNGARVFGLSADKPDRFRGGNLHGAWCDELASWRYPDAWDQLVLSTRIGEQPQIVVTTTPRPTPIIRRLARNEDGDVAVTRGSTYENRANLSPQFVRQIERRYAGTRLGRQEINAEILEDIEGALWTLGNIDVDRAEIDPANIGRTVVAIDPADGVEEGDEQGIAVACIDQWGEQFYVLHSEGMRDTPTRFLRRAVVLAEKWDADRIVYEKNHGGQFLTELFQKVAPNSPKREVNATHGKRTRAEPISALYERHRVHHGFDLDVFGPLEEQMTTWVPGLSSSPDRMDALVWALTDLAGAYVHIDPDALKGETITGDVLTMKW